MPRLVLVSEIPGSGKTTLLNMVANRLGVQRIVRTPTATDVIACSRYEDFEELVASFLDAGLKWISIDDVNVSIDYHALAKVCKFVARSMEEKQITAVLLGDHTLQNETLLRWFSSTIERVRLEPLDPRLLDEALAARVRYYLNLDYKGGLVEEDLLETLLPRTEDNVSTFRNVLSILMALATKTLSHDDNICTFSGEHAKTLVSILGPPMFLSGPSAGQQREFYQQLIKFINKRYPRGNGMPVIELETLEEIYKGTQRSMQVLELEVLEPLCRAGYIVSLGTPYYDEDAKRLVGYPPPYLPSVQTFLRAEYGQEVKS